MADHNIKIHPLRTANGVVYFWSCSCDASSIKHQATEKLARLAAVPHMNNRQGRGK